MTALLTPYATISFPTLFSPKSRSEGGDPVFSCSLLFGISEQKSKEYKAMQTACIEAARAKFGQDVKLNTVAMPFRDASEKEYQGYDEGVMYINPWSKQKPGVVDARLQDVLDPAQVYAGQIVRAQVTPFAWSNTGKKGVSFGLNNIQIVKADAPRIDGRVSASKAFTAVDEDDEDATPF
jgi:hypothetical protein